MFYGLHFTSDAGVVFQIAVNTANCHIFCRATRSGGWSPWRRVDVERNADGTLNERVAEATHARRADTAARLAYPMKWTFTGDVRGEVSFDGSGNVSCGLGIPALGSLRSDIDALKDTINDMKNTSSGGSAY